MCIDQVHVEDGLVGLEDHARVHREVFVQVEPSAICAWFVVLAIGQDPRSLIWSKSYASLALGE